MKLGFILEMIIQKYNNKQKNTATLVKNDENDGREDINTPKTIRTSILLSESEFARLYLRGPRSIIQNIPMPKVSLM